MDNATFTIKNKKFLIKDISDLIADLLCPELEKNEIYKSFREKIYSNTFQLITKILNKHLYNPTDGKKWKKKL